MGKTPAIEEPPFEPIEENIDEENFDVVEYLRKRRAQRALKKLKALQGTLHLNIDIDELRGRNRR